MRNEMITAMDRVSIIKAIDTSRTGIIKYLDIMGSFYKVDVSKDMNFQRKFNGFYRIRQRPIEWYEIYYSYMESQKGNKPQFAEVLRYLFAELKRYEPSFSSKLVATLNPDAPIWDQYVLNNIGVKPPAYSSGNKVNKAIDAYNQIQKWYEKFLLTEEANLIIQTFNETIRNHGKITDLKKVDFVLWQLRS